MKNDDSLVNRIFVLSLSSEMILRCPKCGSDNVILKKRSRYLLKFAICLGVIIVCSAFPVLIVYAEVFNLAASFFIILMMIIALFTLVVGIYFIIKAIRTKYTHYQCGYCKTVIEDPQKEPDPTIKELLAQIKRSR